MYKIFSRYWSKLAVFSLLGEVFLLTTAALLATQIRFGERFGALVVDSTSWLRIATFAFVICMAMYLNDLFDFSSHFTIRTLSIRLARSLTFAALALWGIYYLIPALFLGRGVLALAFLLAFIPLLLWRILLHEVLASRMFPERVILVGTDDSARTIAKEILDRKHLGYQLLGFLDDDPGLQGVSIVNPGVLGPTSQVCEFAVRHEATRVVVAQRDHRGKLDLDALLECKTSGIRVERGQDFLEKLTGRVALEEPRVRSWLLYSDGFVVSRSQRLLKRTLDVVVASVILLLVLPLIVVTSISIRLSSRGPVLYRQARVGRDGKVFTLWKFRSMRLGAEQEGAPRWAAENDPRVTPIGRILRKSRIDELPQLWNVFRGDMSLVGPRPERPEFVAQLVETSPLYELRLAVRPGLTGWAQIKAPYAASIRESVEKLKYDLYYIKNLSTFLDLSILASTFRIVLLGRGAQ